MRDIRRLLLLLWCTSVSSAAAQSPQTPDPLHIELASACGDIAVLRTRIALLRSASEQEFLSQLMRQNLRVGISIHEIDGSPSEFEVTLEFAHFNYETGTLEGREIRSERDASCANLMDYAAAVISVWWNAAESESTAPTLVVPTSSNEQALALDEPTPTSRPVAPRLPTLLAANFLVEGGMLTARDAMPSFGVELQMHIPLNPWLSLATGLHMLFPRSKAITNVADARVQSAYGAASASLCYSALHLAGAHDTWLPCVGVEGGALFGESSGISARGSGFSPSLSLSAELLFRYAIAENFGIDVGLTGLLSLFRPQLVIDGIGSVHQSDFGQIRGKLGVWISL